MIVQKYVVQGYNDPIHLLGHFKYDEFFVKDYKMVIGIKEWEIAYIHESENPRNVCLENGNNKEYEITEVDMPYEFITKCYEILEMQNRISQLKEYAYVNYLRNEHPDDFKEYEYQQHLSLFNKYKSNSQKYNSKSESENAIEVFHKYLENSLKDSDKKKIIFSVSWLYNFIGNTQQHLKYRKIGTDLIIKEKGINV